MDAKARARRVDALYTGSDVRRTLCERISLLESLVEDLLTAPCGTCDPWADGFSCPHCVSGSCRLASDARTLGIEV